MTPLAFEALYQSEWQELEELLDRVLKRTSKPYKEPLRGERIAALYRRACEHLALARARSYPAYMLDRLDRLTADAHQVIYQQRGELGASALWRIVARDFPRAVRADHRYVWLAAALFTLPLLVVGVLVYYQPNLILSVVDASTAAQFEQMYSRSAESIGRAPDAATNRVAFGGYIRNNISIAFQCFASGLAAGLGSIFYLILNGALIGAIAGYLTERGLSETFYSFVVTHGAFELTAIVLSGAAGLKLGHSLLAPGRRTRRQSLVRAASECVVIIYGVTAMLVVAAAIEAFWSSSVWVPNAVKYGVAAVCWAVVLAYFTRQGRHAA